MTKSEQDAWEKVMSSYKRLSEINEKIFKTQTELLEALDVLATNCEE